MEACLEEIAYFDKMRKIQIIDIDDKILEISRIAKIVYNYSFILKDESLRKMIQDSRIFLEKYFQLHDIYSIYKEKKLAFIVLNVFKKIYPFRLPIKKEKIEDPFFGSINYVYFGNKDIFFKEINISTFVNPLTKLVITHEIVHSQIDDSKKVILNYENEDVISIFLETVQAYEEKQRRLHDYFRIGELDILIRKMAEGEKNEIDERVLKEMSAYIIASLKAYHLFLKFLEGNEDYRRKVMVGIQKIFDAKMTVEYFLEENQITWENSKNGEILDKYLRKVI